MKSQVTWILIADGGQARVLAHSGPGKPLQAVDGLDFSQAHLKGQDIQSDKDGRLGGGNVGRSANAAEPETNPVDKREADFVQRVVEHLSEALQHGRFDRLVIAAAPQALGDIRKSLSPQLKDVVMAELPKDLTNTPTGKLADHFSDVLAL